LSLLIRRRRFFDNNSRHPELVSGSPKTKRYLKGS
jgi:hypothetical protein